MSPFKEIDVSLVLGTISENAIDTNDWGEERDCCSEGYYDENWRTQWAINFERWSHLIWLVLAICLDYDSTLLNIIVIMMFSEREREKRKKD